MRNLTVYAIPGNAGPAFLTFGNNQVWFNEEAAQGVGTIGQYGVATWSVLAGAGSTTPAPTSLVWGDDGNLWFAGFNAPGAIGKLSANQSVTWYPINATATPWSLVKGPPGSGYMWFTDATNNAIGRIDYNGNVMEYGSLAGSQWAIAGPSYIVLGPDGNLWFTEYATGGVDAFSPASLSIVKQLRASRGNFSGVIGTNGITVGADNNLYWVDSRIGRIAGISPYAPDGSKPSMQREMYKPDTATISHWIANIAAGPDGQLWVTDSLQDKVLVYNTAGYKVRAPYDLDNLHVARQGNHCGPGVLPGYCTNDPVQNHLYPYGIAFGPDGKMYVALWNGSAIVAITLNK